MTILMTTASVPVVDEAELQRLADLAYATSLRVLGDPQDAADAAQEALSSWWRSRARIRSGPAGWVYRAAHGAAVDVVRRREARRRAEGRVAAAIEQPASEIDSASVDAALAALGVDDCDLLLVHHLQGLDQRALAEQHRCSQATISRRLERARARLAQELRRRGVAMSSVAVLAALATRAEASAPPQLVDSLRSLPTLGRRRWTWPTVIAIPIAFLLTIVLGVMASTAWRWHRDHRALPALAAATRSQALETITQLGWRTVSTEPGDPLWSLRLLAAQVDPADPAVIAEGNRLRRELDELRLEHIEAELGWIHTLGEPEAASIARVVEVLPQLEAYRHWLRSVPREQATGWVANLAHHLASGELTAAFEWIHDAMASTPSDMSHRSLAQILSAAAISNTDPLALDDLDRLIERYSSDGQLLAQLMWSMSLEGIRDDTYLQLALAGRLDLERARAWIAEPSTAAQRCSQGFVSEALATAVPWAEQPEAEMAASQPIHYEQKSAQPWLWELATSATSAWLSAQSLFLASDAVIGAAPPPWHNAELQERLSMEGERWIPVQLMLPAVLEHPQIAVRAETNHNLVRLAAATVLGLPAPAVSANSFAVRAEIKSGVWRFAADLGAELPALADPSRIEGLRQQQGEHSLEPGQSRRRDFLSITLAAPEPPIDPQPGDG